MFRNNYKAPLVISIEINPEVNCENTGYKTEKTLNLFDKKDVEIIVTDTLQDIMRIKET
jgi:hypothetical protein